MRVERFGDWARAYVQTPQGNTHVAVGHALAPLLEEHDYVLRGAWGVHPKFGDQFEVERADLSAGERDKLAARLCATYAACGPKTAARLVDEHERGRGGLEALVHVLSECPWELEHIDPTTGRRLVFLGQAAPSASETRMLVSLRRRLPADTPYETVRSMARWLIDRVGTGAGCVCDGLARLHSDPYAPALWVAGWGLREADAIATASSDGSQDRRRGAYLVFEALRSYCSSSGSTLATEAELCAALHAVEPNVASESCLEASLDSPFPVVRRSGRWHLASMLATEEAVGQRVAGLRPDRPCLWSGTFVDLVAQIERHDDATRTLCAQTRACILKLLTARTGLHVIETAPGLQGIALVRLLSTLVPNLALCAPTAAAARSLSAGIGDRCHRVQTLHALLGPRPAGFLHCATNPLPTSGIVVAGASMLDLAGLHALLESLPRHAHLVLLGDPAGVQSIGPGRVFADLAAMPWADLHGIVSYSEQADGIQRFLAQLAEGRIGVEPDNQDVSLVELDSLGADAAVRVACDRWEARCSVVGADNVVLLAANRSSNGERAALSVDRLNEAVHGRVHRKSRSAPIAGTSLSVDDRFVLRRNLTVGSGGKHVAPVVLLHGESGRIASVEESSDGPVLQLVLDDGASVSVPAELAGSLQPAYARTMHEMLGGALAEVIVVVDRPGSAFLNRRLLLGACGVAQRHLTVIGVPAYLASIAGWSGPNRLSHLTDVVESAWARS